jgi:hypothetical protein
MSSRSAHVRRYRDADRALAACLRQLNARSFQAVELHCHVTDPHLEPVAASLPAESPDPLLLLEIDPASIP